MRNRMLSGVVIAGRQLPQSYHHRGRVLGLRIRPKLKSQSCEWRQKGEPCPKKARRSRLNIKTMVIVFFDIRRVMHHEYIPQGPKVSKKYYEEVLKRLQMHSSCAAGNVQWKLLDHASWQRTWPRFAPFLPILELKHDYHSQPLSILTRFGPLRLLFVSQGEKSPQGVPFGYCCRVSNFVNKWIKDAHTRGVRRLFLKVVSTLR